MANAILDLASRRTRNTTLEHVLREAFDELRWRHPDVRICCGAFMGEGTLHMLASSQPDGMIPMTSAVIARSDPGSVERYRDVLAQSSAELSSRCVEDDARLAAISPSILGNDTRATVVIVLHQDDDPAGDVLGFVRLDATKPDALTPAAMVSLYDAVPAALVAVHAHCTTTLARRRDADLGAVPSSAPMLDVRSAMGAVAEVLDELRARLVALGARLDPDIHEAMTTAVDDARRQSLAALAGCPNAEGLTPTAGHEAPDTRPANVPSTGGMP